MSKAVACTGQLQVCVNKYDMGVKLHVRGQHSVDDKTGKYAELHRPEGLKPQTTRDDRRNHNHTLISGSSSALEI